MKLESLQAYAEKCAAKLGVTDKIVVRWGTVDCPLHRAYAHCHISNNNPKYPFPRGTICVNRTLRRTAKQWHHTMAHEVIHLAVKSNHFSPTFAKRMVTLGVANYSEKETAKRKARRME